MKKEKTQKVEKEEPGFDFRTIKTFEDACKKEGIDPGYLPTFPAQLEEFIKPVTAAYKLMVIFKAINNGWKPDWNNWDQYKYYPWFEVLSSGFGFSYSFFVFDSTHTCVGSRLCFKSRELSTYAGKQFNDIYNDYLQG